MRNHTFTVPAEAKKRLGPGIYAMPDGALHLEIPEILDALALPDTPQNREAALCAVRKVCGELFPSAVIEEQWQ